MEKLEDHHKKSKGKGKQKIRIEPIISKSKQQVTFTKRRGGLFKKASDLCRLSGSQVAIITFSGAGKLYPFGNPNAEEVINRYLNSSSKPNNNDHNNGKNHEDGNHSKSKSGCEFWWDEPIDNLGLSELEKLKSALETLRNRVASKVEEVDSSTMNYSAPQELCSSSISRDNSAPEAFSLASIDFCSGSDSGSMDQSFVPQENCFTLIDHGGIAQVASKVDEVDSSIMNYSAPQELCSSSISFDNPAPETFSLASIDFCSGSGSGSVDQSLAPQGNGFTLIDNSSEVASKVQEVNSSTMEYSSLEELCSGSGLMGQDHPGSQAFSLEMIDFGSGSGSIDQSVAPQGNCFTLIDHGGLAQVALKVDEVNSSTIEFSSPQELCSAPGVMGQDHPGSQAFSLEMIDFGSGSGSMDQSFAPQGNSFTVMDHGGMPQFDDVYPSHESENWLDLLLNSF